jgi:hypothetical protein
MARLKIRYLVQKRGRCWFWQPSPELIAAGFAALSLGPDRASAIHAAEARNAAVDRWRLTAHVDRTILDAALGGGVQSPIVQTVQALIDTYTTHDAFLRLRPSTRRGYLHCLKGIAAWVGPEAVRALTAKRIQDRYTEVRARTPAAANSMLRVLRLLLAFGVREGWHSSNPAIRPALVGDRRRHQLWTWAGIDAMVAAADAVGLPGIADAVLMGVFLGQREGDLLALPWLALQDDKIRWRQSKTGRWIGVPLAAELKARLDGRPRTGATIIVDGDGRPFTSDRFRHAFADVRVIAARAAPDIADLWFMDLRRTCVVRLAEGGAADYEIAAVTGHDIDRCRRILEHYLPRTEALAAAAIAKLVRPKGA